MYATLSKTVSIMSLLIVQLQMSSRITAKPGRQLTAFNRTGAGNAEERLGQLCGPRRQR